MSSLSIESVDVLKLIQQYLREHNLDASLHALQEETHITLNTVENVDKFVSAIQTGRWEEVLQHTQTMTLPSELTQDLMTQIVLELYEANEVEAARNVLRTSPVFLALKQSNPTAYLLLEHQLARGRFEASMYGSAGKDSRRKDIAQRITPHIQAVPPARLLTLLAQAMKYQQMIGMLPKGTRLDLLTGAAPVSEQTVSKEAYPTKNSRIIKFGTKSYPECARFSPDGLILASGSCDGYIELWDADTGKLKLDFTYQAEDQLLSHDSAVLCLAFSTNMELLVSGSTKGDIKVWRLSTGSCVKRFQEAHTEGVTQVEFLRDSSSILSSSFDTMMKIHGLKSGRCLKEFRGHTSFVTGFAIQDEIAATAATPPIGERVLSCSADGNIRVWDMKTADCLRVIRFQAAGSPTPSLLGVYSLPTLPITGTDRYIVVERSGTLRMIDSDGVVLQTFQSTSTSSSSSSSSSSATPAAASASSATAARKKSANGGLPTSAGDFVSACISPHGAYLYGVTEECVLHCFDISSIGGGKLVHAIKLHRADVLGVTHHPHRPVLASYAVEGNIKLWTP